MAELIELNPVALTEAETRKRIYETLNIDPSNVVFAPTFCAKARAAYEKTESDLPEAC